MSDAAGVSEAAAVVHFVVPDAIDDPQRVSGGNTYDRHVRDGLRGIGWDVRMVPIVEGGLLAAQVLAELPDGALVFIDGLIAVRESVALAVQSPRLRMIVLAHMVGAVALTWADRVIATSEWTRSELISRILVHPEDIVTAHPGADPATMTRVSPAGGRLLCVGVVAPHKGQDVLIRALAHLTGVSDWTCTFVGSVTTAPDFVADLRRTVREAQLATRVNFAGTLEGAALDAAYGSADLVVVPSRTESFGMVIAEALARGIPVIASRVGGIPEAVSSSGAAMLVAADDSEALTTALREWWVSEAVRTELTAAAVEARATVRSWRSTVSRIESVLHEAPRSRDVLQSIDVSRSRTAVWA